MELEKKNQRKTFGKKWFSRVTLIIYYFKLLKIVTQKLPSKNLFNNIWMESETLFGSAASWIYGKKRHSSICYIISFTFFFVAQSFIVQAVIIMLKFFKVNLQSWNGVFFALIFIFCLAHSMLVAETDQANKTSVIIYFFKYNSIVV